MPRVQLLVEGEKQKKMDERFIRCIDPGDMNSTVQWSFATQTCSTLEKSPSLLSVER